LAKKPTYKYTGIKFRYILSFNGESSGIAYLSKIYFSAYSSKGNFDNNTFIRLSPSLTRLKSHYNLLSLIIAFKYKLLTYIIAPKNILVNKNFGKL
jgi:hypothetical protein